MTATLAFSPELIEWARRTYWDFTPSNEAGGATFWSVPDGETRYDVSAAPSGWLEVVRLGRYGERSAEFSVSEVKVAEHYFWGEFGKDVRESLSLPRLKFPRDKQDVAPGYSIKEQGELLELVDSLGNAVARSGTGVLEVMRFAQLSHFLSASLEDIKASFLSQDGSPLLALHG
ncbi:MAG: TNT antitoxin family protein [Segniliparus sp.]|uniref:TNT antitoxin family protein n=1 Tax=Segniliparus sp. TaxID=2804064 RepID=UPI003F2ACD11